ncbi:hypothetical protein YQE_04981, partial [Dendroctonus ponderosae]
MNQQPLLFEMFDKLYALSAGKCIYDGPSTQLVPYFNNFNVKCPPYHNPADFLMEVAMGDHGVDLNQLAAAVQQQQLIERTNPTKETFPDKDLPLKDVPMILNSDTPSISPAPVIMQFFLLYKRNLLQTRRNWIAVFIGPVLACCFSIFGFCLRRSDTPAVFRWLFTVSYFRVAFHGVVVSVYGFNRKNLYCPEEELYCHYADPSKFLKEMDIVNIDLVSNISMVLFIWCLMHTATYLTLWFKLNKR